MMTCLAQIDAHYPDGPNTSPTSAIRSATYRWRGVARPLKSCSTVRLGSFTSIRKVLDIGSGLGGLERQGAALGFQITGLDITHGFNVLNKALSNLASSAT